MSSMEPSKQVQNHSPSWIRNRLTGGIAEEKPVNTYDALKRIYSGVSRDFSGLYLYLEWWNDRRNEFNYAVINTEQGKDRVRHNIQRAFGFLPTTKAFNQGVEMFLKYHK